jgi:CzcA family heavy metal efflux pump
VSLGAPGNNPEHWTAGHGKVIVFVCVALALFGAYLAFTIPVSVFPSTNFPRIVVGVDNGVMPIDQMQVTVTRPLEEVMNSVPGLDHINSITSRGSAEIDLFFNWNSDMFQTLQYVNAAVARVQPTLPTTATVTANRLTFAAFPIMGYSLQSDHTAQTQLWQLATYTLKPQLNRLPGVSTIVVQGGEEPEFQIQPDPEKLIQSQITVPNILDAIAKSNLIDSPGLLERNHQLVLGLVSGLASTPAQIGGIVVKTTNAGNPVTIQNIATVSPSIKPVYTRVTANGQAAVLLNLYRQADSNTVSVADAVRTKIAELQHSLPSGTTLRPFYDQSEVVNDSISSVRDAVLIGLILAAVILILFLRDWSMSLIAGLVIPVTLFTTFIILKLLGQSFNLMTLGGLAAAVGLVIDDAIVVVENISLHRDAGQPLGEAIRSALQEIRIPLIGSTVTPIVVFLPLIAIQGVTGTFFRALAITVAVALVTSLVLALTWTPALSHWLLRSGHPQSSPYNTQTAPRSFMRRMNALYTKCLISALNRPSLLALLCVVLVAVSFFSYQALGSDLLPAMDEGGFILDYLMPAGSSLSDTDKVLVGVEQILHETPEVESTSRRTGLQLGLATVTEANTGDISVKLKRKRSRGVEAVISEVRDKVNKRYPQLDTDFIQLLQDMIGDLTSSPDPVAIKLFSENVELLRSWAPKVADAVRKVDGITDIKNGVEDTISGPAITFNIDQSVAARAGFTPQEIELDASAIFQGEPAAIPVIANNRPYTLRVTFPPQTRASLNSIEDTLLISNSGRIATLGTIASLHQDAGQLEVRRENLQRLVTVTGRLDGVSLGTGVQRVRQTVADLHVPSAIRIEYGGLYQEQQKSFRDLLLVLTVAVVLVFIVLLVEFGSFAAPLSILSSALLSTSGVFLALLITGTTFNISSFMGLIMVIGIVAKNGILLLDADQTFRARGSSPREAIILAGERRLRPILMTALAAMAGMIPLALAFGAGSQMLQPLAIAVIGGLLASMFLSLLVTPAVFERLAFNQESRDEPGPVWQWNDAAHPLKGTAMKVIHTPLVDARYWTAILLASVFGTNLGDLYAHESGLSIGKGLTVLALLAAAVFLVERFHARRSELFYWLVIILIRTGATNIADYLAFRIHIPELVLTLSLIALLCLFGWRTHHKQDEKHSSSLPETGPSYWCAMLTAGVFGTVVGDICSHAIGQGTASLVLGVALLAALALGRRRSTKMIAVYWATIAIARTAGTAIGDWLAENDSLHIGLPISTAITGLAFVLVLTLWSSRHTVTAASLSDR